MNTDDAKRKASSFGLLIVPETPTLRQYAAFRLYLSGSVFTFDIPRRFDEALARYAETAKRDYAQESVPEAHEELREWASRNGKLLVPMKGSNPEQTAFFTQMGVEPKTRSSRITRAYAWFNAGQRKRLDQAFLRLSEGKESSPWGTCLANLALVSVSSLLLMASFVLLIAALITMGTRPMLSYLTQAWVISFISLLLMKVATSPKTRRLSYGERFWKIPILVPASLMGSGILILCVFGVFVLSAAYQDIRIADILKDLMSVMKSIPKSSPGTMA